MPDPIYNPKEWSLQKQIGTQFDCSIQCLQDKTRTLICIEKIKCDQPLADSFLSKIFFYCKNDGCYIYSSGLILGFCLGWLMNLLVKELKKGRKKNKKNLKMKDSESGSCAKEYLK